MIDVVTGTHDNGKDWHQVWLDSPEAGRMKQDLDDMITDAANKPPGTTDDGNEFATSLWTQTRIVTNRMNVSMYRNVDYVSATSLLPSSVPCCYQAHEKSPKHRLSIPEILYYKFLVRLEGH